MAIDLAMFADKLQRYINQFKVTVDELSSNTGIPINRVSDLIQQKSEPTGDEVLILADFFKCDFKFFISNEKLAPFEQTESMFRKHDKELSREDRWAIQEFLFLCECQEFLLTNMSNLQRRPFSYTKTGTFYKGHGQEAAAALRKHIEYKPNEVAKDVFKDFRTIGIHIFRRKLGQSAISGLFIRHPVAGPCVLVNYDEDTFRQRFTAAHEVAHAILDDGADFVISFTTWDKKDLSEIRANTFASHLLMPPEFLKSIPNSTNWDQSKFIDWAIRLMVNSEPLAYALKDSGLISSNEVVAFQNIKIPSDKKSDPELSESLSPRMRERKEELLMRGLSDSYVRLCFDGYENGIVTAGRLAEMLSVTEADVIEIAELYGRTMIYGD